jgi:hypothetical protein
MKDKNIYTATTKGKFLKIFINDIIHLSISYRDIISIHSWIMNKDWYCIEFYILGKEERILCEYDSIKKWKSVLCLLDEHLN